MIKNNGIFLFLILLAKVVLSQNSSCSEEIQNKKLKQKFEEGVMLMNKAAVSRTPEYNYNQAIAVFKELEKKLEDNVDVLYNLGYCYAFKPENNLVIAKKYFEKVLEICPDYNADIYYFLGSIYYAEDKLDQTLEFYQKFVNKASEASGLDYLKDAKKVIKEITTFKNLKTNLVPFEPKIVEGISSPNNEYLVRLSHDNQLAFYTRQQEKRQRNTPYTPEVNYEEKFFMSKRKENGLFDDGEMLDQPFNQHLNEGGATLSIDNKELIYTICKYGDCKEYPQYFNCDLYYTRFVQGWWEDLKPLPGKVNSPCTWESMPTLSADGKTLYFVSDRKGGIGGYDIYMSQRLDDGTWSEPINLGLPINTKGNEMSPFIHTDGETFYFSSDGHIGLGGYDIFYSKLDTNGKWQEPVNIGAPINTEANDVGFIVSADGKYGYFASNRFQNIGKGGWDFYSFELYEKAQPEKIMFIRGEVKEDKYNNPIDATIEIKTIDNKKIQKIKVDSETGQYVAAISKKYDYVMTVKKEDFVYESVIIEPEKNVNDEVKKVDVTLKQIEVGKSYRLNDIYYEYNSDKITDISKAILDEFVIFLKENPTIKISIEGHTDNIGGAEFNLDLSIRRAKSVYDYLVAHGISAERLSYKGFGLTRPVASNNTEEGRALNRRTEFVIVEK